MADCKPEKLIPLIRITRKLTACDALQKLKVLQQLPSVFSVHQSMLLFSDIIISGLFDQNVYEKIPEDLHDDILAIFPTDDELDLKDSVYESRLEEVPEELDESDKTTNQKKEILRLTLLRIPTDLQYRFLHYLNFKELMSAQKVCRSIFFVARHALSLHSLRFIYNVSKNHHFLKECYSRPKSLSITIPHLGRGNVVHPSLIGNAKWGQSVNELYISSSFDYGVNVDIRHIGQFENLKKCTINSCPEILRNHQITSYYTLMELNLSVIVISDGIIDQIRKFKNLETLSLGPDLGYNSQNSDPIAFPRLKELSFSDYVSELFARILIGSHPEIVNVKGEAPEDYGLPQTTAAVEAIRAIRHLTVNCLANINLLSPLLQKARDVDGTFLGTTNVTVQFYDIERFAFGLQPVISMFQCAKKSKLHLNGNPWNMENNFMESIVQQIQNAPFDTFNEILVTLDAFFFDSCIERILRTMKRIDEDGRDHKIVKNVIMESIDEAEELMKLWLVFNEFNMSQIGLQKLSIKFQYFPELDFDDIFGYYIEYKQWYNIAGCRNKMERFQAVWIASGSGWIQQRADLWTDIDERCNTAVKQSNTSYTVSFSLPTAANQ